jgi:predicted CopG family antitoxin
MRKKLTITVDEKVYRGLNKVIGPRRVSRFLEDLARPHVIRENLDTEYRDMAADEEREKEALEWSEGLIEDVKDETR